MERAVRSPSLRHDLRASIFDGVTFSLMVGMGESYFAAFALALGMGQTVAGLLSTLPLLAGAALQLVSPRGVRRLGSHRRWVLLCATVQGLAFAPLVVAALVGALPVAGVFLIATLYWAAGMATGPAWNTWIERMVPRALRSRYFARRQRFANAGVFVGLLAGGTLLHFGSRGGQPLAAFALTFLMAMTFRGASVYFLSQQSEAPGLVAVDRAVAPGEWLRRFRRREGRLLLFLSGMHSAVYISAAFFTPFMLKVLHLSYAQYMTLISASLLGKFLTLTRLGTWGQRLGARRLLLAGGIGVTPLPALWLISDNFGYLLAAQLYAGAAWAALDLGALLLTFETIKPDERVSMLTLYNVANAVAPVVGSLIGAALLSGLGETRFAFMVVFLASTLARGAAMFLAPLPKADLARVEMTTRSEAVRPTVGSLERPLLPSIRATQPAIDAREDQ